MCAACTSISVLIVCMLELRSRQEEWGVSDRCVQTLLRVCGHRETHSRLSNVCPRQSIRGGVALLVEQIDEPAKWARG